MRILIITIHCDINTPSISLCFSLSHTPLIKTLSLPLKRLLFGPPTKLFTPATDNVVSDFIGQLLHSFTHTHKDKHTKEIMPVNPTYFVSDLG